MIAGKRELSKGLAGSLNYISGEWSGNLQRAKFLIKSPVMVLAGSKIGLSTTGPACRKRSNNIVVNFLEVTSNQIFFCKVCDYAFFLFVY